MTIDACSRIQRSIMLVDRNQAPLPPRGGLCEGQDTSWWYPGHGIKKEERLNSAKALDMCRKCPVRLECLKYALEWEAFGVWGGFTERQRDFIRKRKGILQQRKSLANSRADKSYDRSFTNDDKRWLIKNGY
jgi:WhiB family redox-sensing transcriptional regulator